MIADAISRLPQCTESIVDTDLIQPNLDPDHNAEAFSIEFDNSTLLQCLLYHPVLPEEIIFPLEYSLLRIHQLQDRSLLQQQQMSPQKYPTITLDGIDLICHITNIGAPWRIVIPDTLLDPILLWYHRILSRIGMTRLYNTISVHFFHSSLKRRIEAMIQSCDICQRTKLPGMGYGHLPPRETLVAPWFEVAVDLIGPWQVNIGTRILLFQALTCIDTVTNLAEVIRIDNKSSVHISMLFENNWLARYPRPSRCIHDNGGEFTGAAFSHMLHANGIKDVTTTVKNPQANAVCERLHQSISNTLRSMLRAHAPSSIDQSNDIMDTCFATAAYASKVAIHRTLNISPGALVFHRDMILNIPLIADLHQLHARRQIIIDERLRRANLRRRPMDYQPGDDILILTDNPTTLQDRGIGPFRIIQVHTNGTITIQRTPHIVERINIRRVKPYRQ